MSKEEEELRRFATLGPSSSSPSAFHGHSIHTQSLNHTPPWVEEPTQVPEEATSDELAGDANFNAFLQMLHDQYRQDMGPEATAEERFRDELVVTTEETLAYPTQFDSFGDTYYQPNRDTTQQMEPDVPLQQLDPQYIHLLDPQSTLQGTQERKTQGSALGVIPPLPMDTTEYEHQLKRFHSLAWSFEAEDLEIPMPGTPLARNVLYPITTLSTLPTAMDLHKDQPSAAVSVDSKATEAYRAQKLQEIRLMSNPQTSNVFQSIRAETGNPLQEIGFKAMTSLEVLKASVYPNRVDYDHEKILNSFRSGHGDLARGERCLTCKPQKELDDPPCPHHPSHINMIEAVTQEIFVPEKEGFIRTHCQVCAASLMSTGAIPGLDILAKLDPKQPIPMTEEMRQAFRMVDLELPDPLPETVADVEGVKPDICEAWVQWNSAQVEYIYASQQRKQKQSWPKKDKRYFNRAWFFFRKQTHFMFDHYKRILIVLPVNWIMFYKEHEEYGYRLKRAILRILNFKEDIFQNAELKVFDAEQFGEAQHELRNWLHHLQFLVAEKDRFLRRDRVFKEQLMPYLEAYVRERQEAFFTTLRDMGRKNAETSPLSVSGGSPFQEEDYIQDFIKRWKFCKEPKCHTWSLEEASKWMATTLAHQWELLSKRRKNQAAGKRRGGGKAAQAQRVAAEALQKTQEEKEKKEKKDTKKKPTPDLLSSIDPTWVPYDFPCLRNNPRIPRPPLNVELDPLQNKGEIQCSATLGGCGYIQRIWRSKRVGYQSQRTEESEEWMYPFYPLCREFIYITPTYEFQLLRIAPTLPYFRDQRRRDLQNMGFKHRGSRPESVMTEHIHVIPNKYRQVAPAIRSVTKQHWTACYLSIMPACQEHHKSYIQYAHMLGPLEILPKDKEDHELFLPPVEPVPPVPNGPSVPPFPDPLPRAPSPVPTFELQVPMVDESPLGAPAPLPIPSPSLPPPELVSPEEQRAREEDAWIRQQQGPLYWLTHYASPLSDANDAFPRPTYVAEQMFMFEHGLLDPMWMFFKNAQDKVAWHSPDALLLQPNMMACLVGSLWGPLTYNAVSKHPAMKFFSIQATIQLKQFEIVDVPKSNMYPVALSKDLEDGFMGSMGSRERLTEILAVFCQDQEIVGISTFGEIIKANDLAFTNPTPPTLAYRITPVLREMLKRDLLLNNVELTKIGKGVKRDAALVFKDHMTAFLKSRTRDKNQYARNPTTKSKGQSKSSGTVCAEISNKKDRTFYNYFQRWIHGSVRQPAVISWKTSTEEVELPREIMMQMKNQVQIAPHNIDQYQKIVDDTAHLWNQQLPLKLALRTQTLQANEKFVDSLFKHVARERSGIGFIRSNAMWMWRAPACQVEFVLLNKRQKLALLRDEIYPAALQIIRMPAPPPTGILLTNSDEYKDAMKPPSASKMELLDLKRYYTRNQFTPVAGTKYAFRLALGDYLILHSVEGDQVFVDRPPTLQFIGMYAVTLVESTSYTIGINPMLWSISNGDYDGDKAKEDQIKDLIARLEVLVLMNPNVNTIDVKSGASVINFMQDSIIGIITMASRMEERWYAPRLNNLFTTNKREVAYKSRATDPTLQKPFRVTDFTESFIARIRQRFVCKVQQLIRTRVGVYDSTEVTPQDIWKPRRDLNGKRVLVVDPKYLTCIEDTYLTNGELLGLLFPETFHYIRYVDDTPLNVHLPPRIEIKDNVWTGIPLKIDLGGDNHSIFKTASSQFGPSLSAEIATNGSRLAIQYNKESALTLSQYGCMVNRKALRRIQQVHKDMTLLEAKEAHMLLRVVHPERMERLRQIMDEDPQLVQQQQAQHVGAFMVQGTHRDHPQQICMTLGHPAALTLPCHQLTTITHMNTQRRADVNDLPYLWYDRRTQQTDKIMKEEVKDRMKLFFDVNKDTHQSPYPIGSDLLIQGYSGSKGSTSKWIDLVLYPGLQLIDGKLEKRTYGDRMNLYYDADDMSLEAFGCVTTPFIYGLTPGQLWGQKSTSHKQVSDSSGAVNITGAKAKDGSKLFGDHFIDTNRSVRGANDELIQLIYNGDGMNPNRAEKVHCWMNLVYGIEKGKKTPAELKQVPLHREAVHHEAWIHGTPCLKWRMTEDFWDTQAPYLDSFWAGHVPRVVQQKGGRLPSLSPEAQRKEEEAYHAGFRLLMHAFFLRQRAVRKCIEPPNLCKDTELQCVDIPNLALHIMAQKRYLKRRRRETGGLPQAYKDKKGADRLDQADWDTPITAFELFEKVTNLRYLLWQLDPSFTMLARKGDTFDPYRAIQHKLDAYLIENLCYSRIVGEYGMSAYEVDSLLGAIFCKWRDSRIPMGDAVGIISVQSVYVDQTQGMLNKKHMEKTVMNELTKGSFRWNQLIENAMKVPKDHLLMIDMAFYSDPEDRAYIREKTGYELWSEPEQCLFFKEASFTSLVPSFTYEQWKTAPKLGAGFTHFEDTWTKILSTFRQFPAFEHVMSTYCPFGSPDGTHPLAWQASIQFPNGFIRMVFDTKETTQCGVDWMRWLKEFRRSLSNSFFLYVMEYPSLHMVVAHVIKVVLEYQDTRTEEEKRIMLEEKQQEMEDEEAYLEALKNGEGKPKRRRGNKKKKLKLDRALALFSAEVCPNVIWGSTRLVSKMKSASVTKSKAYMHVLEDESICLYYYLWTLLQNRLQSVRVKNLGMEEITLATREHIKEGSVPPLATQLLRKRNTFEGLAKGVDWNSDHKVQWKRLVANVQHTEMFQILAYHYQFLLRPDVDPRSIMLIHPAHIFQMFQSITMTRNILFMNLMKVPKELGSSLLPAHVLLMADSVTKGGSLVRFNTIEVTQINDDILTLASHRKTLPNIAKAGLENRKANRHGNPTRTLLSLPINKGTNYVVTLPSELRPVAQAPPNSSITFMEDPLY